MSEKIKPQTFDELREQITPDQRLVLRSILKHYLDKNEWISKSALYSSSGRHQNAEAFKSVVESLKGLVIGVNDKRGTRYRLTLPGVLLGDKKIQIDDKKIQEQDFGKAYFEAEELIRCYLSYLQKKYEENPNIEKVESQDLAKEQRISELEVKQLGKLIQLSGSLLSHSFNSVSDEWSAGVSDDLLIELSANEDLQAYIRERAMEEYDPDLPVNEFERFKWLREIQATTHNNTHANTPSSENFFESGQQYDAYEKLQSIFKSAKESLMIVDNYLNSDVLKMVKPIVDENPNIKIRILSRKLDEECKVAAKKFKKQFANFEVRMTELFHDRFIIIDNAEHYHLGASIKDAGNRAFAFIKMQDHNQIEKLQAELKKAWKEGNTV